MKDTKEKRIYRLFSRSKFIKGSFNEDKKKVLAYYNSLGFRDAQIVSDTIEILNPKNLNVNVKVYEGKKYYFRNIQFVGNNKYDEKFLSRMLGIKKGDIYNTELLDKRLTIDPNGTDISSLYLDDGYLFFRVDPVEVLVEGDSIDVELRVYEGPQATINKIIVEGNSKTSDHVILRELRTIPGDKFSRAELIRSQRELINLGFFNQENMQVVPLPDPNKGTVDIKYVVEEKPSDQLMFQGGWGGTVRDNTGRVIGGGVFLAAGGFPNKFCA